MGGKHDVVLGAGLAGLTAAYTLQQAGESDWLVLEKEREPGGHARSVVVDGYVFDFGPHILFSNDAAMEALIRDLLGDNMRAQERQAFIYHAAHHLYTRFPFQAHLYGLPVELVRECLVELVSAVERRARNGFEPANYEQWMRAMFGDGIADRLMIPYARKIWTVEPSVMDFNWIGRRVPTPDVERIVTGALTNDVAQVGATSHFWYPWEGGIASLGNALADRVTGIEVGREMAASTSDARHPSRRRRRGRIRSARLHPAALLPPALVRRSPARGRRRVRGPRVSGDLQRQHRRRPSRAVGQALDLLLRGRVPVPPALVPGELQPAERPRRKSSVSTEVAYSRHRPLARETMLERTVASLRTAGILDAEDEIEIVHAEEILPAYVIYDLAHGRNVATIREWLLEQRIWTAGRFGEWQYFNMDHSMASGKAAADAILADVPE